MVKVNEGGPRGTAAAAATSSTSKPRPPTPAEQGAALAELDRIIEGLGKRPLTAIERVHVDILKRNAGLLRRQLQYIGPQVDTHLGAGTRLAELNSIQREMDNRGWHNGRVGDKLANLGSWGGWEDSVKEQKCLVAAANATFSKLLEQDGGSTLTDDSARKVNADIDAAMEKILEVDASRSANAAFAADMGTAAVVAFPVLLAATSLGAPAGALAVVGKVFGTSAGVATAATAGAALGGATRVAIGAAAEGVNYSSGARDVIGGMILGGVSAAAPFVAGKLAPGLGQPIADAVGTATTSAGLKVAPTSVALAVGTKVGNFAGGAALGGTVAFGAGAAVGATSKTMSPGTWDEGPWQGVRDVVAEAWERGLSSAPLGAVLGGALNMTGASVTARISPKIIPNVSLQGGTPVYQAPGGETPAATMKNAAQAARASGETMTIRHTALGSGTTSISPSGEVTYQAMSSVNDTEPLFQFVVRGKDATLTPRQVPQTSEELTDLIREIPDWVRKFFPDERPVLRIGSDQIVAIPGKAPAGLAEPHFKVAVAPGASLEESIPGAVRVSAASKGVTVSLLDDDNLLFVIRGREVTLTPRHVPQTTTELTDLVKQIPDWVRKFFPDGRPVLRIGSDQVVPIPGKTGTWIGEPHFKMAAAPRASLEDTIPGALRVSAASKGVPVRLLDDDNLKAVAEIHPETGDVLRAKLVHQPNPYVTGKRALEIAAAHAEKSGGHYPIEVVHDQVPPGTFVGGNGKTGLTLAPRQVPQTTKELTDLVNEIPDWLRGLFPDGRPILRIGSDQVVATPGKAGTWLPEPHFKMAVAPGASLEDTIRGALRVSAASKGVPVRLLDDDNLLFVVRGREVTLTPRHVPQTAKELMDLVKEIPDSVRQFFPNGRPILRIGTDQVVAVPGHSGTWYGDPHFTMAATPGASLKDAIPGALRVSAASRGVPVRLVDDDNLLAVNGNLVYRPNPFASGEEALRRAANYVRASGGRYRIEVVHDQVAPGTFVGGNGT